MTVAKKLIVTELQKGKTAHLERELTSEIKEAVWQKDHREIEMGDKYQETTEDKTQILLIQDFHPADQGVSACVASEEMTTSTNLDLEGICPCSVFVHHQT